MNQFNGGQASPARALDWPATRAALGYRRLWLWLLVLVSAASGPLTVVLIRKFDQSGLHGASATVGHFLVIPMVLLFVFGPIFGLSFLWIHRRRRRALKRYPWTRWQINYITTGRYEWVQLLDPNRQPVTTLILSTWAHDIGNIVNDKTTEVWFAGDPGKYGVVSRPGGADLRYAYHVKAPLPDETARPAPTTRGPRTPDATPFSTQYEMRHENERVAMRRPSDQQEEQKPKRHGAINDPDYPSPRKLRRTLAFALDLLIHLAIGATMAVVTAPESERYALLHRDWHHMWPIPLLAIVYFAAASFANRVIIQAIFHTTIGKAVFGLVTLRPDTGHYPSFGRLLTMWLMHVYFPIGIAAEIAGNGGSAFPDKTGVYFPTAVRWRDLRP